MKDRNNRAFPRDRDGEIFQDDLGEDHTAEPWVREEAAHEVALDPGIDSQEGDEFMHERLFEKGAKQQPTSENPPAERRR